MKLTPKVRIAAGIGLVVAGFIVALAELFRLAGFIALPVVAVAWALVISGLVVLLFRRSQAPIATGLALVLVAPLLWILIVFTPIKSAFFFSYRSSWRGPLRFTESSSSSSDWLKRGAR